MSDGRNFMKLHGSVNVVPAEHNFSLLEPKAQAPQMEKRNFNFHQSYGRD